MNEWIRQARIAAGLPDYATAAAASGGAVTAGRWLELEEYAPRWCFRAERAGIALAVGMALMAVAQYVGLAD